MNKSLYLNALAIGSTLLLATQVQAGGLENAKLDSTYLFSDSNVVHLGMGYGTGTVEGDSVDGSNTGNSAEDLVVTEFGVKHDLDDQWALGLYYHQAYTSKIKYKKGLYEGMEGVWDSRALAGIVRYSLNDNFSVYGGLSAVKTDTVSAKINGNVLPTDYAVKNTNTDIGKRYVVGGAFQIPEIALLTTLTYQSSFEHTFDIEETGFGQTLDSSTKATMPQALTLEFESGIAEDKFVYGSVRWVEWSKFSIAPTLFKQATGENLLTFKNSYSFTAGYAQTITEKLVGTIFLGYEKPEGGDLSALSPYDGYKSIGLGGSYKLDQWNLNAGVEYAVGRDGTDDFGTQFKDISSLGASVSVDYHY